MSECKWYLVYTRPNAEKKFASRLIERGIESYLPLRSEIKKWSDRTKLVKEPLFKSYVFVNCKLSDLHYIKTILGFYHFISFGGYPVRIENKQIEIIKSIMRIYSDTKTISNRFVVGDEVSVINGPFKGMEGVLTALQGKKKVAIKIAHLDQSLLLNLPEAYLIKVEK